MPLDDELTCICRAKAGDQRAFAWLVQRYQAPVYNLCYRMLSNPDQAADAAQETFLRAYSRLKTFEDGRKFSSWLLSIASHFCIDCLRRRRFTWVDIDEMASILPSQQHDEQPEEVALRNESEETIQRLLNTLPPDYRTVVVLYYWYRLSYEEMAQTLGLSEPAIKSRLHRARRALAERLSAQRAPERRLHAASALQA